VKEKNEVEEKMPNKYFPRVGEGNVEGMVVEPALCGQDRLVKTTTGQNLADVSEERTRHSDSSVDEREVQRGQGVEVSKGKSEEK